MAEHIEESLQSFFGGENGSWSSREKIVKELLSGEDAVDLYPDAEKEKIDRQNGWIFENVDNTIYLASVTKSLQTFVNAYEAFFAGLDVLDRQLENSRFLFGDYVTDSDIRLYTTLVRFDISYSRVLSPCKHRIVDYRNLWPYLRDLYQIPAFHHNTDFQGFADSRKKGDFYGGSVYYDMVVPATDFDAIWKTETGRETLSGDPANKLLRKK